MLSDDAIKAFKELCENRFQVELTDEEAYQRAQNLLNLYKTIYVRPSSDRTENVDEKINN